MVAALKNPGTTGAIAATKAAIARQLKPLEYDLRFEAYDLKRQALGQAIFENLILAESAATNAPTNEIIQREVSDKMRDLRRGPNKIREDERGERAREQT